MIFKILRRCVKALVNITAWEFVNGLFGGFRTLNKTITIKQRGKQCLQQ